MRLWPNGSAPRRAWLPRLRHRREVRGERRHHRPHSPAPGRPEDAASAGGAADDALAHREQGEVSALEAIESLLGEEYTTRESRRIKMALQTARLPTVKCVFRKTVTGVFGIVTDGFGNVTGHFGDVTDGPSSVY